MLGLMPKLPTKRSNLMTHLFPCHSNTLGVFERWSMRKWRHNVSHSLFKYIEFTRGTGWRADFFSGGKRKLGDSSTSTGKRCRRLFRESTVITPMGDFQHLHKLIKSAIRSVYALTSEKNCWCWVKFCVKLGGSGLRVRLLFFWRYNGIEQITAA